VVVVGGATESPAAAFWALGAVEGPAAAVGVPAGASLFAPSSIASSQASNTASISSRIRSHCHPAISIVGWIALIVVVECLALLLVICFDGFFVSTRFQEKFERLRNEIGLQVELSGSRVHGAAGGTTARNRVEITVAIMGVFGMVSTKGHQRSLGQ